MIHRDIKPANVLRSEYGHQLSDFGIARLQGGHETKSGVITASIAHAPPEILDGHAPSERSDVYSLGSTLYEALSGRTAFSRTADESLLSLVRRVMAEPVPDLGTTGAPEPIARAIVAAMAKEPADRYASAEEFGQALRQAQASLGVNVSELMIVGSNRGRAPDAMPTVAIPPGGAGSASVAPPSTPEPDHAGPTAERDDPTPPHPATVAVGSSVAPGATAAPPPPIGAAPASPPPAQPPAQPSSRPPAQSPVKRLAPWALGGAAALGIAIVALWPRGESETVVSDPPGSTETVDSALPSTTADATTDTTANTTADPEVIVEPTTIAPLDPDPVDLSVEATVAAMFDVDPTTTVDGFSFTGIDGTSYDAARSRILAAKEPAPAAVSELDPALTDPAVFFVPLGSDASGTTPELDFASASAVPVTDADGVPYGFELDIEGMVALDDGGFILISEGAGELGSEGEPFAHRFGVDGRFVSAFEIPEWYRPSEAGSQGLEVGRGLHGVDQRPGSPGEVVVAVEGPLLQDHDPTNLTEPKVVRLIAFDVESGTATTEWGYPLDVISPAIATAVPTASSLIADIAHLDDGSMVVLELTNNESGGRDATLYRVVLDAGSVPGPGLPNVLQKTPITLLGTATDELTSSFRSIGGGPILPDGEPSLVAVTDNTFDDEPTQVMVISVDAES